MRLIGDKLKASLLQDAFQGKLTKQLPEDGDARDLLKEIKAEKERLVKEKKIKEEKPLPVIKDEEIPFDIPKNWIWIRLGDCSLYIQRGRSPRYSVIKKYPVISQKCIQWSGFDISAAKFIDPDSISLYGDERILQDNDLLWNSTGTGTVGRVTHYIKINNSYNFAVADSHVTVIRFYPELMDPIYIEYFIRSEHIQKNIENLCTGSTKQKELSLAVIKSMPIPLPPLAEQRRIVDKLKTALEKTDELKFFETKLSELEKSFPNKLKASLLQAAFQGKLTKQLPEDGDARDLLKEIQAENDRLVEEKKIKKEKPSPVIKDEEIPFNIPKNWVWARLGKIGYWSSGKTPNRTNFDYYNDGTYNWLKTGDLTDGNITSTSEKITEKALRETSVKLLPRGSVLIAMYGATIGKLGILEVESTTNQACCGCIPYNGILNYYLFYFLLFSRKKFIEMGAGCAQPNISKEKIINTIIPVPPVAEQRRILDKLKTALEKIESLNES